MTRLQDNESFANTMINLCRNILSKPSTNILLKNNAIVSSSSSSSSLLYISRSCTTTASASTASNTDRIRQTVWMFGSCADGKLGVKTESHRSIPTKVTHLPPFLSVKEGGTTWMSSFLHTNDSKIFMWGTNNHGQMGLPGNQVYRYPTESEMFKGLDIERVALGRSFLLILTKQGKVLSIGSNEFGQLGISSQEQRGSQTLQVVQNLKDVVSMHAGFDHSFAVTKSGHAFGWGYNVEGQLGQKIVEYERVEATGEEKQQDMHDLHKTMHPDAEYNTPTLVPGMEAIKVAKVFCGYDCTFLLSARGNVYAMGNNETGTLGLGEDAIGRIAKATKVQLPEKIKSISCGATHSMFLSESNKVYVCGWGAEGRLGLGNNTINRYVPTLIPFFAENRIKVDQVSCGGAHSLLLTTDGRVYSWGCGEDGKLGHGDEELSNDPKLIQFFENKKPIFISAGVDTSMVITTEN
ncbi:regulator of chromosome condensation domain-containing protein [Cavenderia fasciculata]|uniref:Regulator of chromosome condensation domain-containing protein n=1 Tax=Cavenderia fasciculata TaxID=261658 RepID=F4PPZ3_CACFS|nr:regulator of chromosome condensation domain-containing protein [Cavenderia fasciculata]EGG22456.1 regulator of chromosome condensation domain-containing protein [Cavenderia fasciculata]|eukprot:XP_004360307.1 regulator of chromosome condensation domain-containing protein [Cavenderia fasciculata]